MRDLRDKREQDWRDPEVRLNNMLSVTNAIDMRMPEDAARGIERAANFPPYTVISVKRGEPSEGQDIILVESIGKNGQQVVTPINLLTFELQTPQGMTNKFAAQRAATLARTNATAAKIVNDNRLMAAELSQEHALAREARGATMIGVPEGETLVRAYSIIDSVAPELLDELSDGDETVKEGQTATLIDAAQMYMRTPQNAAEGMTYEVALQYTAGAYQVAIKTKDRGWLKKLLGTNSEWFGGSGQQTVSGTGVQVSEEAQAIIDRYELKD